MFFFLFVTILIFQVFRGVKVQNMAQNNKKFCLLHLIFQEPYIIWSSSMIHIYLWKDNISSNFFSFFLNFDFWDHGNLKRQKMAQNYKTFCLSHFVSQEPYIIWLWSLVHMCKMMISPALFFIFSKFWFLSFYGGGIGRGVKGEKWPHITNFSLFCFISQ